MKTIYNALKRFLRALPSFRKGNMGYLNLNLGKSEFVISRRYAITSTAWRHELISQWRWVRKHGDVSIMPERNSNPHMLIVGMSGFGKSTLLKSIVGDIFASGRAAIILDAHDEYSEIVSSMGGGVYDSSRQGVNLFALDGSTVGERISELSGTLRAVFSLGHIQTLKLSECMWYAYRRKGARTRMQNELPSAPTLKDLLAELAIFIRNSKTLSEKNTLMHLKERISAVDGASFSDSVMDFGLMKTKINSFSLASTKSRESRIIYISELLRRLYNSMKDNPKESGIKLYVIIDEAQFILGNTVEGLVIKRLIEEGRKYGVGVIIATHLSTSLPKEIIANASTFISFYPREPSEINYVSNIMAGGDNEKGFVVKQMLNSMRPNQAIIISDTIRNPFLINTRAATYHFGHPAVAKMGQHVTASQLLAFMAGDPVRYEKIEKRFGPGCRGVVESLLSDGSIDQIDIPSGDVPERWIMRMSGATSIEHQVIVFKISEMLSANSVEHRIVNNSTGPDIEVYGGHEKIAIEYETGRKSISKTAGMVGKRLLTFSRVIMVVNDMAVDFYSNYFKTDRVFVIGAGDMQRVLGLLHNPSPAPL